MRVGGMMGIVVATSLLASAGCGGDDTPARGERDAGIRPDSGPPPGRDAGRDAGPSADDPRTLARAAVVMSSCLGGSAGELLFTAYGAVAPPNALSTLLRQHAVCIVTEGGGCAAIDACLGIELDVSGECTAGCDGDVAVFCGGGHVRWRCVEDRPLVCVDGAATLGPACGEHGALCDDTVLDGEPGCVGTGETCTSEVESSEIVAYSANAIECVDDAQLAACINGKRQEVFCDDLFTGTRCRTTSEAMPRAYCGLSTECNPFTTVVEFCTDRSVAVCNAGRLENVSCESLGFARCNTGHCE